jgi:4-hydroxybenzoate polyprenyltransferase
MVYGLEYSKRENNSISSLFKALKKHKGQQLFVVHLTLLTPLFLYVISWYSMFALLIIALLGLVYSIELKFINVGFKLKQVFFLKNIIIGLAWGLLVLLGGNNYEDPALLACFFLSTLQIIVGSILRDVADFNFDIKSKTKTVPIILGLQFTFPLLHLLNLLSASVLLVFSDTWILFVVAFVVAWKALIIEKVRRNNQSDLWTQTLNILTCSLILILVLIFKQ